MDLILTNRILPLKLRTLSESTGSTVVEGEIDK